MASAPRHRRARRAIRDRSVPRVLAVTITLALLLGLAGVAYGAYRAGVGPSVAATGPSLGVPLSSGSSAVPADSSTDAVTGSPASGAEPATTPADTAADTPTPTAASSTTAAVRAQGRATTAPVSTAPVATAPSTPPPPSPSAPTPSAPPASAAVVEQQVLALTNTERAAAGCQPLTWNATLGAVARAHSEDMAANNYFDHNSPDGTTPAQRITAAGYTWTITAENIAAGQATPADVMASWLASAAHKANIDNCALTEVGVGFATGGSYGTYWTQDFGTP